MATAPWNLDAGEVLQEGPPLAETVAATREPLKIDVCQRALTYEQLCDLLRNAVDLKGDGERKVGARERAAPTLAAADTAYHLALAGLVSVTGERDRYRAALEKIATVAHVPAGVRTLAKEALR